MHGCMKRVCMCVWVCMCVCEGRACGRYLGGCVCLARMWSA